MTLYNQTWLDIHGKDKGDIDAAEALRLWNNNNHFFDGCSIVFELNGKFSYGIIHSICIENDNDVKKICIYLTNGTTIVADGNPKITICPLINEYKKMVN